jgi:hypothetical protein
MVQPQAKGTRARFLDAKKANKLERRGRGMCNGGAFSVRQRRHCLACGRGFTKGKDQKNGDQTTRTGGSFVFVGNANAQML